MKTIILLLVLLAPLSYAQRASSTIDSIPVPTIRTHILTSGSATIGAGDSVSVSIDGVTPVDIVLVSYAATKTAEVAVTTVLSWDVTAVNRLTIYGTLGKSINYIIIR